MISKYLVNFDEFGKILQVSYANGYEGIDLEGMLISQEQYLEICTNLNGFYIEDKQIIKIADKPADFYIFDYETKQWVLDRDAALSTNKVKRNALLQESDWTQLPDVDLSSSQKAQWATYRQELRNMTDNALINGDFPNKPY